jgi:uncharacterized membrane protein YccC
MANREHAMSQTVPPVVTGTQRSSWTRRLPMLPQMVTGALGFSVPIAAGILIGHVAYGTVVALAALAIGGGAAKGERVRRQLRNLVFAVVAGSSATFIGAWLAAQGITADYWIAVIAAIAGLIGGISRRFARSSSQFIVFLVIISNVAIPWLTPLQMMLLFLLGAVWSGSLTLLFGWLFHSEDAETPQPEADYRKLFRRWVAMLKRLEGWQYALRIGTCLAAAEYFKQAWPNHHAYWAVFTVAIVVHRSLGAALDRALHRAAGTVLGAGIVSLLLLASPSEWTKVALIGGLAAMRPLYRESNYTMYAAVMTPLVILLLDFQQDVSRGVIVDRLLATLVGCIIALTLGYLVWLKIVPARAGGADGESVSASASAPTSGANAT